MSNLPLLVAVEGRDLESTAKGTQGAGCPMDSIPSLDSDVQAGRAKALGSCVGRWC